MHIFTAGFISTRGFETYSILLQYIVVVETKSACLLKKEAASEVTM